MTKPWLAIAALVAMAGEIQRRLAAEPGIDNTSIYWVDARVIEALRPQRPAKS